MAGHLFIEGPIQEGKSTLIRKLIKSDLAQVGGFSSQRLIDETGVTAGFRITSAGEALDLTRKYSPALSDIFLRFDGCGAVIRPEVFTETAVRYLKETSGKKLILLDEIGGVELLAPEFRRELYCVLAGEIPCIGVLKLETSNRSMCGNGGIDKSCVDYHMRLRDDLHKRFKARIVSFERANSVKTENEVSDFLLQIFSSGS